MDCVCLYVGFPQNISKHAGIYEADFLKIIDALINKLEECLGLDCVILTDCTETDQTASYNGVSIQNMLVGHFGE